MSERLLRRLLETCSGSQWLRDAFSCVSQIAALRRPPYRSKADFRWSSRILLRLCQSWPSFQPFAQSFSAGQQVEANRWSLQPRKIQKQSCFQNGRSIPLLSTRQLGSHWSPSGRVRLYRLASVYRPKVHRPAYRRLWDRGLDSHLNRIPEIFEEAIVWLKPGNLGFIRRISLRNNQNRAVGPWFQRWVT